MKEYLESLQKTQSGLLLEQRAITTRLEEIDAMLPKLDGAISALQQIAQAEDEKAKATDPNPVETKVV